MGRKLKFSELKTRFGWPHSRQWTAELVKDGKIPAPKKRPGGSTNLWDEDEWIAYYATFVGAYRQPACLGLTAALIEALSTNSIDGIVAAIGTLRAVLEREGAGLNDVIVSLKERPAAAAAGATTNTTVCEGRET